MIFTRLFLSLMVISSTAIACPDLSGEYKRVDSESCSMFGVNENNTTPIFPFSISDRQDYYISDGETFQIEQRNCTDLTFSHQGNGSTISKLVKLNFGKIKIKLNEIVVKEFNARKICYFGCEVFIEKRKASIKKENDGSITLKARYSSLGAYMYFIPTADVERVNCNFQKIN